MSLFNTYELANTYLLHIPRTNDTKMFKTPGLAKRIMRIYPEVGAFGGFRAAKEDCTGAVSTCVCERAGMVAVRNLLYEE